uniref:Uncharacterized protein n=1 Tax=Arundo donax TaxID=35708 RepID=A0A0A9GLJ7_ARUDO
MKEFHVLRSLNASKKVSNRKSRVEEIKAASSRSFGP